MIQKERFWKHAEIGFVEYIETLGGKNNNNLRGKNGQCRCKHRPIATAVISADPPSSLNRCLTPPSPLHSEHVPAPGVRHGAREEGEHEAPPRCARQRVLLRPDGEAGRLPHVHLTGTRGPRRPLRSAPGHRLGEKHTPALKRTPPVLLCPCSASARVLYQHANVPRRVFGYLPLIAVGLKGRSQPQVPCKEFDCVGNVYITLVSKAPYRVVD